VAPATKTENIPGLQFADAHRGPAGRLAVGTMGYLDPGTHAVAVSHHPEQSKLLGPAAPQT
jgi:hypothetical protein